MVLYIIILYYLFYISYCSIPRIKILEMLKINIQVSIIFKSSKNKCMKINHFSSHFIVGLLYFIIANKNNILKRSSKNKCPKLLCYDNIKKPGKY